MRSLLPAGDRVSSGAISYEVQFRLKTMLSRGGRPGYRKAFRSNPADPCMWRGEDGQLDSARDASISGQFAQWWELRVGAQGAAPKEIAGS